MVIQKPVISLLVMVTVLVGCGEDEPEKVKPKEVVDEESKKRIIWKKDGAEMRLIPAGSFEMGDPFKGGDADDILRNESFDGLKTKFEKVFNADANDVESNKIYLDYLLLLILVL